MTRVSQNRISVFLAVGFAVSLLLVEIVDGASLYWTDERGIHHSDLDGQNPRTIVPIPITSIASMAVDEIDNKIYYADSRGKRILRSNLDGTELENVITSGLWAPSSIVVDGSRRKVYWIDQFEIYRANLDGTDIEMLLESWEPFDLAIDEGAGKIYWLFYYPKNPHTLGQANLDGTDSERFLDTIQVANLNGMNQETLVTVDKSGWWHDIDLDNTNQKMYWVNRHKGLIQRANLDGSDVETVVSDLAEPKYIALDLVTKGVVAVEPEGKAIVSWGDIRQNRLLQNYPNPFNPDTWIPYQLAEAAEVKMKIYDTHGLMVRALAIGYQPAGLYQSRSRAAYWDGRNKHGESVASGIYFCTLTTGDFATTQKMSLSK